MGIGRRTGRSAVAVGAVLLLAACASGITGEAQQVTDEQATLTGRVTDTSAGSVTWWFEHGPTTAYGSATPHRSVEVADPEAPPAVSEVVTGLAPSTTYHHRLCARDAKGHGVCGADRTFTTASGHDSVTGTGVVFRISQLGYAYGAILDASSDPDGSAPRGRAGTSPGRLYFRLPDAGDVTCLRVEGNRATIGYEADLVGVEPPGTEPARILVFVEDNGATGDRLHHRAVPEVPTTCPAATDADFPPLEIGGQTIPPVVTDGGFTIRDDA